MSPKKWNGIPFTYSFSFEMVETFTKIYFHKKSNTSGNSCHFTVDSHSLLINFLFFFLTWRNYITVKCSCCFLEHFLLAFHGWISNILLWVIFPENVRNPLLWLFCCSLEGWMPQQLNQKKYIWDSRISWRKSLFRGVFGFAIVVWISCQLYLADNS